MTRFRQAHGLFASIDERLAAELAVWRAIAAATPRFAVRVRNLRA